MDAVELTLEAILQGTAAAPLALLVTFVVDYLKATFELDSAGMFNGRHINGAVASFIITLAIFVFAFVFTPAVHNAAGGFMAFVAWVGTGMATVGSHRVIKNIRETGQP